MQASAQAILAYAWNRELLISCPRLRCEGIFRPPSTLSLDFLLCSNLNPSKLLSRLLGALDLGRETLLG